jgi:hypothetical protein
MDNFLITGLGAKKFLNTSGLDFCWEKKNLLTFEDKKIIWQKFKYERILLLIIKFYYSIEIRQEILHLEKNLTQFESISKHYLVLTINVRTEYFWLF